MAEYPEFAEERECVNGERGKFPIEGGRRERECQDKWRSTQTGTLMYLDAQRSLGVHFCA